jgi:hypothetical protein
VTYSLSRSGVTLGAGESATVVVTMTALRGASGDQQAVLDVTAGGQSVAHAALYTLMK